jgi:hypothetical protein
MAEHPALARTGDRDARACRTLRHEDADDGIARGRVAELLIGRLGGHREFDRGDDLALFQRR